MVRISVFLFVICLLTSCDKDDNNGEIVTSSETDTTVALCNSVLEFLPAPGQFVNEGYTCRSQTEANAYALDRITSGAYVSLGSFGGRIVVGFDHSIRNSGGDYDIAVGGNSTVAFSEPGVVWVMQDANGDGIPNDGWHELRGAKSDSVGTIKNYAVTYYRPVENCPTPWTDNMGLSGSVRYLSAYHRQEYYYPLWVESDQYTLSGTRLASQAVDVSGEGRMWTSPNYGWGYADNYSEERTSDGKNLFRIADADTVLAVVDFVMVQSAVLDSCGWIGEVSTEVTGVWDYHLLNPIGE